MKSMLVGCLWILEPQDQLKTGWKQQALLDLLSQVFPRPVLYACFHLASKEHSEMHIYPKRTDSVMGNLIKRKSSLSYPKADFN